MESATEIFSFSMLVAINHHFWRVFGSPTLPGADHDGRRVLWYVLLSTFLASTWTGVFTAIDWRIKITGTISMFPSSGLEEDFCSERQTAFFVLFILPLEVTLTLVAVIFSVLTFRAIRGAQVMGRFARQNSGDANVSRYPLLS